MFLYKAGPSETTSFAPDYSGTIEREATERRATFDLWETTRDLQMFRDNANAEDLATAEAYERRNKAIFDATGVQLQNPRRDFTAGDLQEAARAYDAGGDPLSVLSKSEADWQAQVAKLARERPDVAALIGAERPIAQDAQAIAREAEAASGRAAARADAAGLGGVTRMAGDVSAAMAGMMRDPLQVGTLFLGGGVAGPAKTALARIFETMLTEAVVNAGVEAGVQAAALPWKEEAGLQHGLGQSIGQIGLAALFGGGIGGLTRAAAEAFGALGRAAPEEPLARMIEGRPQPGDYEALAEALSAPVDPETARVIALAGEQDALDEAAFGPRPPEFDAAEAERAAAQAIRAAEDPADLPPRADAGPDLPERAQQVDAIVRRQQPLGPAPKRPVTLMQFLASSGGLVDHGGELKALGLSRKFVPGSGQLVRKTGKPLDRAREAAAEAGYFDNLAGDPDRATAETTVADLLNALDEEARGKPLYSPRADGGRMFAWMDYEQRQLAQQSYRRLIEDVQAAQAELGLDTRIDDAILIRAAELVDDETDPVSALERAIDEDYRSFYDAQIERGGQPYDDSDIPFFGEDAGTVPRAGEAAGTAGADGGLTGRGAAAPDRGELFDAGADEGEKALEPATPAAAERAALALTEARGAASERTAAGEQTLLGGVAPVTTREKLEAQAAKPMRGGDRPAGGMFDETKTKQIDIWDTIPLSRDADGTVRHVTYDELVADAERDDFFGDLIASCKD